MCCIPGCKYPSVNKKYDMCQQHNYIRMHGKTQQEEYAERAAKRPIKLYQIKTYAKPRQQTGKEATRKKELSTVKTQIELDAVQNGEYYCQGCGKSHVGLDKSHILAVGYRKDLELLKENIQLMCRDCHLRWESKDIDQMIGLLCFAANLEFIRLYDDRMYNYLYTKLQEHLRWEAKFGKNQ